MARAAADEEVPPSSDPRWSEWCRPLLDHLLLAPSTWDELKVWRLRRDLTVVKLQNMLDWLSLRGLVRRVDGKWAGR